MNSTYREWEGGVQYKCQVSSEYMYVSCLVSIGARQGVYSHPSITAALH